MKFLKRIEVIGFVLMLLLIWSNLFIDFPGQDILTGIIVGFAPMIYLIGGFFFFSKSPLSSYKFSVVFGAAMGFAFSILITGMLFKIQMYQGSKIMMYAGMGMVGAGLLAAIIMMLKADEHKSYWKGQMPRLALLLITGIVVSSYADDNLLNIKYGDYPFYIEARKAYDENPTEENLQMLIEADEKMDSLKRFQ